MRGNWAVGGLAVMTFAISLLVEDNEFLLVPLALTATAVILLLLPRRPA